MAKVLAEAQNIAVLAAHGGRSQPAEDQGRATGYGLLTQKLGLSPTTMLDFLGGLGRMNTTFPKYVSSDGLSRPMTAGQQGEAILTFLSVTSKPAFVQPFTASKNQTDQ